MSDKSLDARDAKRDIGVELLEAVRSVKAGVIGRVPNAKQLTTLRQAR